MLLLLLSFLNMEYLPAQLGASYTLEERHSSSQLNLTTIKGQKAKGWLVQEFREKDAVTRWYATVTIEPKDSERLRIVISYHYGEKHKKGGGFESWPMDQRRDEVGKLLESGDLKIIPDTWKRVGPAKPTPKQLNKV